MRNSARRTNPWVVLVVLILVFLYYLYQSRQAPGAPDTSANPPTPADSVLVTLPAQGAPVTLPAQAVPVTGVIGNRTKSDGCKINGPYPDPACTPGAIFPDVTKDQVCTSGYSSGVRNVATATKDAVYAEYGITSHTTGQYEVDHFISLELGGSNDIANLFPEAAEPRPGFHEKDQVENYLHAQVCSGSMSLHDAQLRISSDWLSVYKQMPGN